MPRSHSILSRTRRWWASTIFAAHAALLLPAVAGAQTVPMDQPALVKDLSGRDWLKRFDAASAILGIPAAQRDKPTIVAVVREIQRLQKLKGRGVEELPASVNDRNAARTYYGNLLDIAGESGDPVAIPVLIAAAKDEDSVVDALARHGEAAVPQLLAAAQSGSPAGAVGAMSTFGLMLEQQTALTAESRASIVEIDRRYLSAGSSEVVERAIDLAVLLDEPPLVARLTKIAHARTEREAGLTLHDPENLLRVAATARKALAKVNGPEPMRREDAILEDLRSPLGRVANDAAAEILSAPPARRTPVLVAELLAAMPRLMQMTRADDDRGSECGFKCELLDLAVKADDPNLIPVLVKGIGVGFGSPIQWLVKQGDVAAPVLADEALLNADPAYLSSALLAFRLMLERQLTLSATSRAGMASVVRHQLSSRYPNLVSNAIEIAALLGDASLAPRLREIADAHTMREAKLNLLGGDAAAAFTKLSTAASKALLRIR